MSALRLKDIMVAEDDPTKIVSITFRTTPVDF